MSNNSFYTHNELESIGLKAFGKEVSISRKVSFYRPQNISIGNNVRIDDFCIISGDVNIGSYVHIACYVSLFGEGGIILEDFSGLSSKVSIYSANDDYLGEGLTGPTVPDKYRKVDKGKVIIRKHVVVGSGSIILPHTEIGIGSTIGALSLIKGEIPSWCIYSGIPASFKKKRKSSIILKYENELLNNDKGEIL
ncbi:MAG: acyltransferase [Bacteroidales bacterium]|nr:acyltransferase [Bacteroidales bacterium]